jgi:hypothetical protein
MRRCQWALVIVLSAVSLVARAESGGARHHDRQLGFSLDLPPRWTVAQSAVPGIARFHGERCTPGETPSRGCREYVVVIRATAEEGETSEAAYRRRMRPWKMLTEGRIVVDGEPVPWGVMDYEGIRGDPKMRLYTVVVVRDRKLFEFTGWSRVESYSETEPVFQEMVRSLAFP